MSEVAELISGDKFTRRKILDELYRNVRSDTVDEQRLLYASQLLQVAALDSVSSFREKASLILLEIFLKSNPTNEQQKEVFRLIAQRIKEEPIEETRLALVQLFNCCVKNDFEVSDLDPIANTVKTALNDSFHKIISCVCYAIIELSKKPGFNLMSDYFVEPLIAGLKRKQIVVRVDCAQALSPVLSSSTLHIPDTAARLFRIYSEDENPKLQLAVITSVGNAAIAITPSAHNFHHLLPILFVGMCSEFTVVQEQSEKLWTRLKSEHDCTSVKKNSQWLISFCRNGSEDWTSLVRIHSAKLLQIVITELGQDISGELNSVMELIVHQSGDSELSIITSALKSCELIGKFCSDEAVEWLVSWKDPFDAQILAGIFKGSEGSDLDVEICLSLLERFENSPKNTKQILECVEVLLKMEIDLEHLDRLLIILLSVGEESGHLKRSVSLLEHAAVCTGHLNILDMIRTRLPSLWSKLPDEEIATGDSNSRPWNILNFVVYRLDKVDAVAVKIIHQYLVSNSLPDVKMKSVNLLTASMAKLEDCCLDEIGVVSEIRGLMRWKAGRTAAAIRSAAALCMWSMLENRRFYISSANLDEFLTLVLPLVEDEVILTRLTATRILKLSFRQTGKVDRKIDDVFTKLAGRADDISKEVRREAILALEDIFVTSGQFGEQFREKLINLLDTLRLDDDQSTRQTAEGVLKSMEKCRI